MTLHKGIDGKMYKLRLKIPYNFDPMLVDKIAEIRDKHKDIEYFFYLPCWIGDEYNTRQCYKKDPSLWEDYIFNIEYLKNKGFYFEVLFQQPGKILSEDILKKYLSIGTKRFTLYEDQNAIKLKELSPKVYTCASITKVLRPEQISKDRLYMYDEICLFFWYNRNLSDIDLLPKDFEYSLISNINCSANCSMHFIHWFDYLSFSSIFKFECPYRVEPDLAIPASFTKNDYVKFFSKKISLLKITDRSSPTQKIVDRVSYYSGDLTKIGNLVEDHTKEYFNIKSSFPKSISISEFNAIYQGIVSEHDNK